MLTWNALSYVKITLESLKASNSVYNLVIVDNGSDTETVDYLKNNVDMFVKDMLIKNKPFADNRNSNKIY